ncbi:PTS galactosamine transporter subunit IIC [Aneurinibacillus terranovensis]|uniref:PTS galactosamine transporter subunit IIC n=1 Tax=Aneurinibacillus terranovensis TaxID=278991 RepID=UPI000419A232|nr:PTS galactosamine transporter subunit IIC [Aneurinibacillus terranovensis]
MDITLTQGIILAIVAIIAGFDFWLEGLYIFRPIIVCTLTGVVVGDTTLGIVAGGLTELAFAGLTPAGGTQPPNPILAGVMTVVIAHTTGHNPATSIGLALPFSFLMQYIILFFYSIFSVFMVKSDQYAAEANTKAFARITIIPMIIVALTYGVVVFLCGYIAQEPMKALVHAMPDWLSHGFEIAGGILPAVGFGLLLKVMLKAKFVPYLLIGFLAASFIKFSNLLPVAVIGAAAALYQFYNDKEKEKLAQQIAESSAYMGGGFDDGI